MNPELLLEHGDFVRALARSLLFDEHQVDDVVQDAWVAALEGGPRSPSSARAWFASVVRNQIFERWRKEKRRRRREEEFAPRERIPSTAEVAAREAARKEVVDAVLALDEIYRSILLLRFFEGLPPREIAERIKLPVQTVYTRQQRGLAQLREKLDAQHDGNRQSWCLGLVPIAASYEKALAAGAAIAGSTAAAGVALGAKGKLAAAVLLMASGAGAIWMVQGGRSESNHRVVGEEPRTALFPASPQPQEPPAAVAVPPSVVTSPGAADLVGADAAGRVPLSADPAGTVIWGKVSEAGSADPLPGTKVQLMGVPYGGMAPMDLSVAMRNFARRESIAAQDGAYRFERIPAGVYLLGAPAQKSFTLAWPAIVLIGDTPREHLNAGEKQLEAMSALLGLSSTPRIFDLKDGASKEIPISMRRGGTIQGKAIGAAGKGIAGARVIAAPSALFALPFGSETRPEEVALALYRLIGPVFGEVVADEDGTFQLDGACGPLTLLGIAPGYYLTREDGAASIGRTSRIDLYFEPNRNRFTLRGRVVDPEGKPVPGASVSLERTENVYVLYRPDEKPGDMVSLLGRVATNTGPDGTFALEGVEGVAAPGWNLEPEGEPEPVLLVARDGESHEGVSKPFRLSEAPAEGIEVVVTGPIQVSGTVVDSQTELPIVGAKVDISKITKRSDEGRASWFTQVSTAVSGKNGRFIGRSGTAGEYRVSIEALGYRPQEAFWHLLPNGKTEPAGDLRILLEKATWEIRVKVLQPSGKPWPETLDPRGGGLSALGSNAFLRVLAFPKDPSSELARFDGSVDVWSGEATPAQHTSETGTYVIQPPDSWKSDRAWVALLVMGAEKAEIREVGRNEGDLEFRVDPEEIEGRVVYLPVRGVDRRSGKPVSLRSVELKRRGTARFLHATLWNLEDGAHVMLPKPGEYELKVSATGYATTIVPHVTVAAGSVPESLTVSFAPESKVRGRVENAESLTSEGSAWVHAFGPLDDVVEFTRVRPDGTFELLGLSAGRYRIQAQAGTRLAEVSLELGIEEERELSLRIP